MEKINLGENKKNITLSDLIDIDFLQEFQDFFARNMGIAAITTDENGPITKASNFTGFCSKFVRGEKESLIKCDEFHTECGKIAAKKGNTFIYTCPNGLTEFAVPIIIKGQYIASIIGGQFFSEPPSEEDHKKNAQNFGVDEETYLKEIKEIKVISSPKIEEMAHLLTLLVKNITNIADKNFELIEKNKRENIYRHIEEIMRTSFDINLIKQEIVIQTVDFFKPDRVAFADYVPEKDNYFISPENEYRSSERVKTFVGYDFTGYPGFIEAIKNLHISGKDIIFNDLDKYLKENNLKSTGIEGFYREMGFSSSMAINICHGDIFYGNLVISFEEKNKINEEDIKFIKVLAEKAGTSLYQAELYSKTIKQAKRETLLRKITERIRSSLDIEETLEFICEEVTKLFNVQRANIIAFVENGNYETRKEYKTSQEIKGFEIFKDTRSLSAYWGDNLIKSGETLAFDDIEKTKLPEEFKEKYRILGVKSIIGTPIKKEQHNWGALILTAYDTSRHWTDDEKTMLNAVASQLYIAINQAELYQKIQLQAEREKISRNMIEILRSTLDKNIIKHLFVKNIGKYLNADRVYFSEFNSKTNEYLNVDNQSEYLANPREKSFINFDFSNSAMGEYLTPLINKRELLIPDWNEYLIKHSKNGDFTTLYKDANVKSSYNFPVLYEGKIMGFFCIDFTNKIVELIDEDINRIRSICSQAGIALYQAKLYEEAQKAIQLKEEILAKISKKIKEPVNNIINDTKILSESEIEADKHKKYLDNIIDSCNQLSNLIKEIINEPNTNQ